MSSFVTEWARAQVPRGSTTQPSSVFLRNLEQELDIRREQSALMTLHNRGDAIDFSSGNMLGLSTTSVLRTAFLNELEQHRNFSISSGGSRLTDGNSEYLEGLEQELAEFHGAEAALFVLSGAIGNGAIFSVIPRPGDAIVYDELAHASILDGMKGSLALCQKAFRHNRVDSFRDTLEAVKSTQPQIANGSHSVLVAVESMYSMDGDTCPLKELVDIAKEVFPKGNIEFVVDEAWTTGVVGPRGAGLVAALGLENDIAIRLHTCGKALGASGGKFSWAANIIRSASLTGALHSGDNLPQYRPHDAVKLFEGDPLLIFAELSHDSFCSGSVLANENRSDSRGEHTILSIEFPDSRWPTKDP